MKHALKCSQMIQTSYFLVSCGELDFLRFHYKFGIGFHVIFVTCGTDVVVTGIKKKFL